MASRGSVIPLFLGQIEAGEPITVTDPQMSGVEAVPVGQLAGQPVDRLLDGHERSARGLRVSDVPAAVER